MGRGNISIPSRASLAFLCQRNGTRKRELVKWKREKTVPSTAEHLVSFVFISLFLLPVLMLIRLALFHDPCRSSMFINIITASALFGSTCAFTYFCDPFRTILLDARELLENRLFAARYAPLLRVSTTLPASTPSFFHLSIHHSIHSICRRRDGFYRPSVIHLGTTCCQRERDSRAEHEMLSLDV